MKTYNVQKRVETGKNTDLFDKVGFDTLEEAEKHQPKKLEPKDNDNIERLEKMKNQNNFFENTFAVFQISDIKEIENLTPDYISYKNKLVEDETYTRHLVKTNEVSSIYYYNERGVYRLSNHWGGCNSCFWFLEERKDKTILETILETDDYKLFETLVLGFCSWNNFYNIIEKEVKEISEEYSFLAFEFNSLYFTRKLNNITPIAQHPNHKSEVVRIVDIELKINEYSITQEKIKK